MPISQLLYWPMNMLLKIRDSVYHISNRTLILKVSMLQEKFDSKLDFCLKYTRFSKISLIIDINSDISQVNYILNKIESHKRTATAHFNWQGN